MIEYEGCTEWKLLRIWQPSPPWIIENWLNSHSQRGTKQGSFYGCACRNDSPYSVERAYMKGRPIAYLMSPSSSVSKRMTDKRELLVFFFLNYGHKYRRLEIITNPFSSLPEVGMLKFGLMVLYLEAQQVYWVLLCKEMWSQNSTAYMQPRLMICR